MELIRNGSAVRHMDDYRLNHAEWMQSKENGISSEVHKVQSRKQWWYRSIERAERSEAIIWRVKLYCISVLSNNDLGCWESVLALGPGPGRFGARLARELPPYRPESIGKISL